METCWVKKQPSDVPIMKKSGQVTLINDQKDSSSTRLYFDSSDNDDESDAIDVLVEQSGHRKSRSHILSITRNADGEPKQK